MEITEDIMLKELENVFNLKYDKNKEIWVHTSNNMFHTGKLNEILIPMEKHKIKEIIQSLKRSEFKDICFYNPQYFEKLVVIPPKEKDYLYPFLEEYEDIFKKDDKTGLTFEISGPSLDFIMASYISFINNEKSIKSLDNCPAIFLAKSSEIGIIKLIMNFETRENIIDSLGKLMFFEYETYKGKLSEDKVKKSEKIEIGFESFMINGMFKNIKTIKLSSKNDLMIENFEKLCDSFIFSLGYNIDIPILEFRHLKKEDIGYNSRLGLNKIEIPKKEYIKELIYYYQQALSSDNPLLEYLSFYQILEYFYGIVAREDLMNDVKNKISHPQFSYMDDESILQLIKLVRKGKFEESKALISVLKRYLKLDELKNDLINYRKNENYYEYYTKNKINFANAEPIKENKKGIQVDTLSERIYNVRNALIHSKEGEKNKYVPFSENENELRKELPLIRLVAEQIIINTAEDLRLD